MSTALPSSTNILCTLLLATLAVMTKVSVWGWCTYVVSALVKTMSSSSRRSLLAWRSSVWFTYGWGGFLASFAYLSHALRLSLATCSPPMMVKTSFIFSKLHCLGHLFLLAIWGFFSRNSLKYLAPINLSISSLRVIHLLVLCPMSLWKAQFFFTSLCDLSLLITFGFLYSPLSVTA